MISVAFALIHCPCDEGRTSLFRDTILPALEFENVNPKLIFDYNREGIWASCKRAWISLLGSGASHGCVLADDMLVCPQFMRKIEAFVSRRPGLANCIFQPAACSIGNVKEKMLAGEDFLIPNDWISWGGSLVLPLSHIESIIAQADKFDSMRNMDDCRLHHACLAQDLPVWNIGVSLLRHLGAKATKSWSDCYPQTKELQEFRLGYNFDIEVI